MILINESVSQERDNDDAIQEASNQMSDLAGIIAEAEC